MHHARGLNPLKSIMVMFVDRLSQQAEPTLWDSLDAAVTSAALLRCTVAVTENCTKSAFQGSSLSIMLCNGYLCNLKAQYFHLHRHSTEAVSSSLCWHHTIRFWGWGGIWRGRAKTLYFDYQIYLLCATYSQFRFKTVHWVWKLTRV